MKNIYKFLIFAFFLIEFGRTSFIDYATTAHLDSTPVDSGGSFGSTIEKNAIDSKPDGNLLTYW